MARKHLLDGLTSVEKPPGELPAGNSVSPAAAAPSEAFTPSAVGRGAIGAVSRSFEHIRANSVLELSPSLIDPAFVRDRLDETKEGHEELKTSIREGGQQVPILVRPHPQHSGRYQIAYGHRRWRAAAELEISVRAIVKNMTDEQLIIAQGQENSVRRDLSFIERALYAVELEDRQFPREMIMAALNIDKTWLSRLIAAATRIPKDIIRAIGSAPSIGRNPWMQLAAALDNEDTLANVRAELNTLAFPTGSSDDRFKAVLRIATAKPKPEIQSFFLNADDGRRLARIRKSPNQLAIVVDKKIEPDFASFLAEQLPELYARFKARGEA